VQGYAAAPIYKRIYKLCGATLINANENANARFAIKPRRLCEAKPRRSAVHFQPTSRCFTAHASRAWLLHRNGAVIPARPPAFVKTRAAANKSLENFAGMARILIISSSVAQGYVGLANMTPVLQRLGHDVIGVPSVVLSNHYGYEDVGGFRLEAGQLGMILGAIRANGWLTGLDAVVTGFLETEEQVDVVAKTLALVSDDSSDALYMCDPVLGDDPDGLYITEDVAGAVRDTLVPMADIITPNRFELSWLSGQPVDTPRAVDRAAEAMDTGTVIATSIPAGEGIIANVISDESGSAVASSPRHDGVPHGTGDLFAALFLGHLLHDCDDGEALARAAAGTDIVVKASLGSEELNLIKTLEPAIAAEPLALADLV